MLTVGRLENGVMVEEWLYWDNQAFMKQIGFVEKAGIGAARKEPTPPRTS